MRVFGAISIILLLLVSPGCATDTATNHDRSSKNKWGEPANPAEYMGKQFVVVSGGGPGGYGFFPVTVPRKDGSVTYIMKIQFVPDQLRMVNYCIYQDHTHAIVETLRAQIDAPVEPAEKGYAIRDAHKNETERNGKQCGVELTPGKYELLRNNKSLRMYMESGNYLELVSSDTARTSKEPGAKMETRAPSDYVDREYSPGDKVIWFGKVISARSVVDHKTNEISFEYLCRYYELAPGANVDEILNPKRAFERKTIKVKRTPEQYFVLALGPVKNYVGLEKTWAKNIKETYGLISGIVRKTVVFEGYSAAYVERNPDGFPTTVTRLVDLEFVQ